MTALDIKIAVGKWALMAQPRSVCATEFYNADVWIVNSRGYSTEYEVKITQADLNSELKIIKAITEEWPMEDRNKFSWNKHRKHQDMLTKQKPTPGFSASTPNRFFFAVPPEFVDLAVAGCEHTHYGVLSVDLEKSYYDGVKVVKRAQRIHSEIADERHLRSLGRRVSLERFFNKPNEQ